MTKKQFYLISFIVGVIIGTLVATITESHAADKWRTKDTVAQVIYTTFHVIDWSQTRYISKNCDRYYETNSILGRCPSTRRVDQYFVLTGLAHLGISYLLPHGYREVWQYTTIVVEAGYTINNRRVGIQMDLPF